MTAHLTTHTSPDRQAAANALRAARNLRGQAARKTVAAIAREMDRSRSCEADNGLRQAAFLIARREHDWRLLDVATTCRPSVIASTMLGEI